MRSPLAEAGLTKDDVRALSRAMGLPTWDLPASPCLSSRVPYGTAVTPDVLRQVERAEAARAGPGLPRAARPPPRHHAARVEIAPAELDAPGRSRRCAGAVEDAVRAAGYADGGGRSRGLPPRPAERGPARPSTRS